MEEEKNKQRVVRYDDDIMAIKGKYTCLQFIDKLDLTIQEHLLLELNHENKVVK